jgi:exonuclease III
MELKDNNHGNGKRYMMKYLKVATWYVRGITHKLDELNRELGNRKIDIAVILETRKKSKVSKELDNYVMIYSGVPREASSGVAILVRKDWKNRIIDCKWISTRNVQLKTKNFNIYSNNNWYLRTS